MITRKKFLESGAALVAAPLGLQACAPADASDSYEVAVKNIWRPTSIPLSGELALQRELVRCTVLAPSSHNTQCWKFHVEQNTISILPDLSRHLPVVDPDDHHLFVSLGCALENLAQASLANGLKSLAQFDAASSIVEVPLQRQKLAGFLGLKGGRPDLVVRFGRCATTPSSMRRRVEAVLV